MSQFVTKVRTAFALGLLNIGRASLYRLGVKLRGGSVTRLQAEVPQAPFFVAKPQQAISAPTVDTWINSAKLFSRWPVPVGENPPDWMLNPLTRQRVTGSERPWWQIPDFDEQAGDIKLIWEFSRMDWVLAFAQAARQGEVAALHKLNAWLADWAMHNPPYFGPNWKCGQEASIRVIHLAVAVQILEQVEHTTKGLRDLISVHLERIEPTIHYAMAQDNNHGTSEAAALFIGGSWLARLGVSKGTAGQRWGVVGWRTVLAD